MCRMQPSRLSPAQPRERPSETCDMKARTPEVMPHGGLNIIVPEQGGQTLDRQAVWTDWAWDQKEVFGGRISYGRNRGVMIVIIDNNTHYRLLSVYRVQSALRGLSQVTLGTAQ